MMRRALLVAAGLAIGLLLGELLLRVHNPFHFRVRGDQIVLAANQQLDLVNTEIPGLDRVITHRKNALGFRGPDPPRRLADHLTIVMVGGSTTECMYLSDGDTWPDHLALRLALEFEPLWWNNAGLDGHSTFGHTVLVEDHLARLRPDVAVFLVGINDIGLDAPQAPDRKQQRPGWDLRSPGAFWRSLRDASEVGNLMHNLWRNHLARRAQLVHRNLALPAAGRLEVSRAARAEQLAAHRVHLAAYEGRLRHLLQVTRRASIRPVLVTQPMLGGLVVDDATGIDLDHVDLGNGTSTGSLWELLEHYNDVTRQVAAATDTLLIDLGRELPKSSRLFYDHVHFTRAGAAEVAAIVHAGLAPALRRWFPQRQRPR